MLLYNQNTEIDKCKQIAHMIIDKLINHLDNSPAIALEAFDSSEDNLTQLSDRGKDLDSLYNDLMHIAVKSTNFSSVSFAAFPDSGNELSGILGGMTALFLQQNLINQKYCAPLATFIDMAVIRWMREYVGYQELPSKDINELGGIITTGGTISNVIALLMARTRKFPQSLSEGIKSPTDYSIVIPADISHYSIKSGLMWLGCGNNFLEVKTNHGRYDIDNLRSVVSKNHNHIMAVIAYAGDSKTMTIEHLKDVHNIVKSIDSKIWLHVDACNGFCLAFSDSLKYKLDGINLYDSISLDPHKMMMVPYTASLLLLKDPKSLQCVQTYYDFIMSGDTDLGVTTPFIGSKAFISLKIWSMMQSYGKEGLASYVEARYEKTQYFKNKIVASGIFKVLNSVDAFAVVFVCCPDSYMDISTLNTINLHLHQLMIDKYKLFFHCFRHKDLTGEISMDEELNVLRFFSGNPGITYEDIDSMIYSLTQEAELLFN